ncbi:MAG: Gfo/Idh/MocA family oxidoreductase [Candidatus Dormiibacterota bacterium]
MAEPSASERAGPLPAAQSVPPRAVRLLQVGLGGWGRNWAKEVLPSVPEVQPIGWVDVDPGSLQRAQVEAGIPGDACFASVEEAVRATVAEAILVTTSLPSHVQVVRLALESGLHVLVEKPFAPSVAEAMPLVQLAEARGRVLMVSQNYRFHRVVRAVTELVQAGSLGPVDEVHLDFRRYSGPDGGRRRHHDEEQPLLVDMSIHHFDLLRLVLGREPTRIYCRAWRPDGTHFAGPPVGDAIIEFDGGATVSYRGSWISAGAATPWSGEWRMECRQGEIRWTGRSDRATREHELVTREPDGGEQRVDLAPLRFTDRAGALHEFADAILSGRTPESSGRDNLRTLALMEAAVASATSGEPVSV